MLMTVVATHTYRYHDLWELYKKAVASFWTVEEVDLSQDMRDWDRLTGDAQLRRSPTVDVHLM